MKQPHPRILIKHQSLTTLPKDVLLYQLAGYLPFEDYYHLSFTCKRLYELLNSSDLLSSGYADLFPDLGPKEYLRDCFMKWGPNLYRLRALPHSVLHSYGGDGLEHTFEISDHVSDISVGAFSYQILTAEGTLKYTTNLKYEGNRLTLLAAPLSRTYCATKFVAVSSGHAHYIALDNRGRLWSWGNARTPSNADHLQVYLADSGELVRGMTAVRAGWRASSALVRTKGIAVWDSGAMLFGSARAQLIPGTRGCVEDWVVLDGSIVFLTRERRLFLADISGVEAGNGIPQPRHLRQFDKYLARASPRGQIQLAGCYHTFSVVTEQHEVVIGDIQGNAKPVSALKSHFIVSVAVGKSHFLALSSSGRLYCWGREQSPKDRCLCFGEEERQRLIAAGSASRDGAAFTVPQPTRVQLQGAVVAMASAETRSVILEKR